MICLYAVWLLAREVAGEFKALIAVVALEAIHFYNFSVVKFAHDQMQLPFWALTGLFFWRAIVRGRTYDWMLAGAFLAGAFWSKYAAFALAATLGLILLIDPFARRAWRTPGPYVMAAVFAIVIAPNIWWLVNNDFMPFRYVEDRAAAAARWYQYLLFPLRGPAASSPISHRRWRCWRCSTCRAARSSLSRTDGDAAFNRRYVASARARPVRGYDPCRGRCSDVSRSRCGAIRCGRSPRWRC